MTFADVQRVSITGNAVTFYDEGTTSNLYTAITFPVSMDSVTISNDDSYDTYNYSFDGATLEGSIKPGESITVSVFRKKRIYLRGVSGGTEYRVWGV